MIDSKRLGRKTGRGFYEYDKKGKKVDESVYELLGVTPAPRLNKSEIAKRCVSKMLNEAVRCLDDGIIASPRDGDIGAIFGIGFPPFLGGPFSYMDKLGASKISSDMSTLANSDANFAPCESLVTMASSGTTFYNAATVEVVAPEVQSTEPQEQSVTEPEVTKEIETKE